jgi:hypothetical protein
MFRDTNSAKLREVAERLEAAGESLMAGLYRNYARIAEEREQYERDAAIWQEIRRRQECGAERM